MKKVVKFGGSSLASAEQFKKVGDIIRADKSRPYVVPSAPGKRSSSDTKVTDMLYSCYNLAIREKKFTSLLDEIHARYNEIIDGLNLELSLDHEFDMIRENFGKKIGRDYAASRGEYLNGIIMANYLGFCFIDAAEVIRFHEDGSLDDEKTNELLSLRLEGEEFAVIPGFYGAKEDGTIVTFSRGGSDITGSLVARAAMADLYENWTDVSGFLMADPRIVRNPKRIRTITYSELRELSYMGASVLHEEAIFPVREANIPINILNTNQPDSPGTIIVNELQAEDEDGDIITGIAGKKDFTAIALYKNHMSDEVGIVRKTLSVFERYRVSIEHIPSGIDTFSIVVASRDVKDIIYDIINDIRREVHPDNIRVIDEIALISTVGRNMSSRPGISGRLFAALGSSGINIRMIAQGSDEINIIVGVENKDFEKTISVIYEGFVGKENKSETI